MVKTTRAVSLALSTWFVCVAAEQAEQSGDCVSEIVSPADIVKDASPGVCAFQVKFESTQLQSAALLKGLGLQTSQKIEEVASLPGSNVTRLPQTSLLRLHAKGIAGWTALGLFFCLCLCGTAAGEYVLDRVSRLSQSVAQLNEKFDQQESAEATLAAQLVSSVDEADASAQKSPAANDVSEDQDGARLEVSEQSGKLYEEYLRDYWDLYSKQKEPDIFEHDNLRINKDGGMKEVPKLQVKYMKAAFTLSVSLMNVILIMTTDIFACTGKGPTMDYEGQTDFLLAKWIQKVLLSSTEQSTLQYLLNSDLNKLVPLFELMYVAFILVLLFGCLLVAAVAPLVFDKGGRMERWTVLCNVFWFCLPHLMSCSALRLLHYVQPTIFMTEGSLALQQAYEVSHGATRKHYMHSVFQVVFFGISRIFALVLGFDAFLVKFRLASSALDGGKTDYISRLDAIAFVWQVMGIVHLVRFMEQRLFIFLFAGKGGTMNVDEEALTEVWKALLLQKVYATFGFWRGTVVMLGFDTYDFQFLALDDDEEVIRANVSRRISMKKGMSSSDMSSSSP